MTVCIAAISLDVIDSATSTFQQPIILCSDRKIESWTGGGEVMHKQMIAGNRWAAMISGDDVAIGTELVRMYREHLNACGLQTSDSIIETLKIPARKMRRRLIEKYVELHTGLSFEEFLAYGSQSNPLYDRVNSELGTVKCVVSAKLRKAA